MGKRRLPGGSAHVAQGATPWFESLDARDKRFLSPDPGPWYDDLEVLGRRPPLESRFSLLEERRITLYTEDELEEGDVELDLLCRTFETPMLNAKSDVTYAAGRRSASRATKYRTAEYLTDRNTFFGSRDLYRDYLTLCHEELDANDRWLRRRVEPPILDKKKAAKKTGGGRVEPDWEYGQDVFYAWVRKAYEKQNGADASLALAIKQGKSEKLIAALEHVRVDSGIDFQSGGYNARPMKKGGYRLGTLSEHATGSAIDIESATNAQIEDWASVEAFTGIRLTKETRASMWATSPMQLHAAIVKINDTFVTKLKAAITVEEKAGHQGKDALDEAIKNDVHLSKLDGRNHASKKSNGWVNKWRNGFFSLPWKLVKELQEEGLKWGAVFSTPDLHHFEFPSQK